MIIWGIISVCTGATFLQNILIPKLRRFLTRLYNKVSICISSSPILIIWYKLFRCSMYTVLSWICGSSIHPWRFGRWALSLHSLYIQTFFSSSSQNGTNGMNYLKGRPFFFAVTLSATRSGLSLLQQSLALWKGSLGIRRGGMIILSSVWLKDFDDQPWQDGYSSSRVQSRF